MANDCNPYWRTPVVSRLGAPPFVRILPQQPAASAGFFCVISEAARRPLIHKSACFPE